MTLEVNLCANPPAQAEVRPVDWIVTNNTGGAVALNKVYLLPTGSDGYVTTCISCTSASVGVPGANIVEDGWFGVVIDLLGGGGLNGTPVKVRVKGTVDILATSMLVLGNPVAWAADQLFTVDTGTLDTLLSSIVATAGEANKKLIGMVVLAEASTHGSTLARTFLFDGINGFGRAGGAA